MRITAHSSVISHTDMSTHGSPRLTGPLLFREMFFHSRRWSWCRNPILPPASASLCPKCTKLASRRWPVSAFKQPGDFYRLPRHPVRACHGARMSRPQLVFGGDIQMVCSVCGATVGAPCVILRVTASGGRPLPRSPLRRYTAVSRSRKVEIGGGQFGHTDANSHFRLGL